jgi:hypothetical protein
LSIPFVNIDIVCINQLGVEERNQQVRSMGEFYKAAQQTIVWLGPEAEHIALAFQYILEREHVAQTQGLKQAVVDCQYYKSLVLEDMVELLEEGAEAPENSEEGSLKESQRLQELKHHSLQIQEVVELWARNLKLQMQD